MEAIYWRWRDYDVHYLLSDGEFILRIPSCLHTSCCNVGAHETDSHLTVRSLEITASALQARLDLLDWLLRKKIFHSLHRKPRCRRLRVYFNSVRGSETPAGIAEYSRHTALYRTPRATVEQLGGAWRLLEGADDLLEWHLLICNRLLLLVSPGLSDIIHMIRNRLTSGIASHCPSFFRLELVDAFCKVLIWLV